MSRGAVATPPAPAASAAEESFDLLRRTVGRLLAADRRLRSREQLNHSSGLSSAHMRALFGLMQEPEATIGSLAKAADVTAASATAMVDHLEARGLVERRRSSADRRQCWISLTDAGRAEVEAKERQWRASLAETFADVTPAEIAIATQVLERMVRTMEQPLIDADTSTSSS